MCESIYLAWGTTIDGRQCTTMSASPPFINLDRSPYAVTVKPSNFNAILGEMLKIGQNHILLSMVRKVY